MAEGKYSNKRQINLQQAKNNPNVKFNNYEILQQKYDVKTIHQMESLLRATGIGYLPVEVKYGAHVSFVPRSDYHFATANPHILENIDTYASYEDDLLDISAAVVQEGLENQLLLIC